MHNNIQQILSNNVETSITCTGRKLGTNFQIKVLTQIQHEHNLIYHNKYPQPICNENYLVNTGKIIIKGTTCHSGR